MIRTSKMGKFATMAALPLMAVVILAFSQADFSAGQSAPAPLSGTLVVADLRGSALYWHGFEGTGQGVLALPGPPHEMVAVDGRLYLTLGRANAVVEIDPKARAILRVAPLAGEPHGLASRGGDLLVTLDKANLLTTIDRAGWIEKSRVATGDTPHAVAVAADGVFVTESLAGTLVNITTGERISAGTLPEAVAVVGDQIVVADATGQAVLVFSRAGFRPVGHIGVGGTPVRVVALPDGKVAVAVSDRAQIAVIDLAAGRVSRRVAVPERPDGMCVSPDGAYVAVASNGQGRVDIFSLPNWVLAASLDAGEGAGACAWLP